MPKSGSSLSSGSRDFVKKTVASHPQDHNAAGLTVNYSFPCPGCGELIALPPQSRLGWAGSSQFLATAIWPIPFLCNRYTSVSEVPSSAIRLSADFLARQPRRADSFLIIEGDCCLENCGKRHFIYTHFPGDTEPGSILQTFLSSNPYISCLGGHTAKFQRDRLGISRLALG